MAKLHRLHSIEDIGEEIEGLARALEESMSSVEDDGMAGYSWGTKKKSKGKKAKKKSKSKK
jgi:hypothetical protein